MRKLLRLGLRALPHAAIVLSLMFILFEVLDEYNPMMGFVDFAIEHFLLTALCALTIALSGLQIAQNARTR